MSTIVVKLGGAAITDKSIPDTLSPNLDSVLDAVADAYHRLLRPHGRRLILIHGAGSFGHPPAKKYQVKAGWTTVLDGVVAGTDQTVAADTWHNRVKFGMALTRQRVLQLHVNILQRLHDRGRMPVLSVSTYDTVDTDNGDLTSASANRLVARVRQVLDQDFVPLLFGDAVLDARLGSTILSGDALMYHLARRMPAMTRCVFVTDVAGIFTQDPKQFPDAVLIPRIHCADKDASSGGVMHVHNDSATPAMTNAVDDVTGAMLSKWQWARRIVTGGTEQVSQVVICQASDAARAIGQEADNVDAEMLAKWTTIVL